MSEGMSGWEVVGGKEHSSNLASQGSSAIERNLSYNLHSLCDFPFPPLLPCSFSKEKKKRKKKKWKRLQRVTKEQTGRHLPLALFIYFFKKKRKGDRANSSLQSPHSLNKPNGGCWQGIDSLLMKEFLTKWQPVWDALWSRILPQTSTK